MIERERATRIWDRKHLIKNNMTIEKKLTIKLWLLEFKLRLSD